MQTLTSTCQFPNLAHLSVFYSHLPSWTRRRDPVGSSPSASTSPSRALSCHKSLERAFSTLSRTRCTFRATYQWTDCTRRACRRRCCGRQESSARLSETGSPPWSPSLLRTEFQALFFAGQSAHYSLFAFELHLRELPKLPQPKRHYSSYFASSLANYYFPCSHLHLHLHLFLMWGFVDCASSQQSATNVGALRCPQATPTS